MLRTLAEALDTSAGALCGETPAPSGPARRRGALFGALALGLCAGVMLGFWRPAPEVPAAQPAAAASTPAPHRVVSCIKNGITYTTQADGLEEVRALLEALPGEEPGAVEPNYALADAFSYFAGQYELCFVPDFQEGAFLSDWDQALLWFYRSGLSRGGLMTVEAVDGYVERLFGPGTAVTHRSTEQFPLREEGYRPECGGYSQDEYALTSLCRMEDGAYKAVIRACVQRMDITLVLATEEEALRFCSIGKTTEQ